MKTDFEIQKDVMDELKWQPLLKSARIGVAVKNGIVTLTGTVESYSQKKLAEKVVKKITGVRAIAEDLTIDVLPIFQKSDAQIAEVVLNALKWHNVVPDQNIKVTVEKGVVTLEGEVNWNYERIAARNAVVHLLGVKDVINQITLKPKNLSADVKNKIISAFHRTATIDSNRIDVKVSNGNVILSGKVRSYAEKDDAADAAWAAPGVVTVQNKLELIPEEEYSVTV